MTTMKNALKSGLSALALIGLTAAPSLALTPEEALGVMGIDPASAQTVNGMLLVENVTLDQGLAQFSAERLWFDNLRVDDEGLVRFDRLVVENAVQSSELFGSTSTGTIDLVGPDAATSDSFARGLAESDGMLMTDANGWVYQRLDMRDLQTDYTDPASGTVLSQIIGEFSNENAGPEIIQRSAMRDFSMAIPLNDTESATFRIGEVVGEDLPVMKMDDWDPEAFMNGGMTAEQMAAFSSYLSDFLMGNYGRIALTDMVVDIDGLAVTLDEVSVISTEVGDQRSSVMQLNALSFVPSPDNPEFAPALGVLASFGTDRVVVNGRGESLYDPATDRWVTSGESFLEWAGVMRLDSTIDLAGYGGFIERYYGAIFALLPQVQSAEGMTDEQFSATLLPEMMAAVNLLSLSELSFTLTDYTLIDGVAAIQAAEQGMDPAMVRQGYAGMASMSLLSPPPGVSPELNAQLGASLVKFLGEGGSITFRMSPETPLTVPGLTEAFAGGAPDLNMFGLSVEAQD